MNTFKSLRTFLQNKKVISQKQELQRNAVTVNVVREIVNKLL